MQLDEGELAGAVGCHEHVQSALLGADLSDVDVEEADWVALELAPLGLVAFDIGHPPPRPTLQYLPLTIAHIGLHTIPDASVSGQPPLTTACFLTRTGTGAANPLASAMTASALNPPSMRSRTAP